jgi:hypothetical protein
VSQLHLGHSENSAGAGKPFLTDPEIVRRLEAVEAALRSIIRTSQERPFVAVGRAADEVHRLAVGLSPDNPESLVR